MKSWPVPQNWAKMPPGGVRAESSGHRRHWTRAAPPDKAKTATQFGQHLLSVGGRPGADKGRNLNAHKNSAHVGTIWTHLSHLWDNGTRYATQAPQFHVPLSIPCERPAHARECEKQSADTALAKKSSRDVAKPLATRDLPGCVVQPDTKAQLENTIKARELFKCSECEPA